MAIETTRITPITTSHHVSKEHTPRETKWCVVWPHSFSWRDLHVSPQGKQTTLTSAALFDHSPARRRRFRLHRSWSGVPISPRAIELAQPGDTICLEGILECGAVVDRTSLTITGSAALDCLHSGTGLVVESSGLVLSGMTHQSAVADNYSAVRTGLAIVNASGGQ